MDTFLLLLGPKGIVAAIGIMVFFFAYKNSIRLFNWIEDQTYGSREYLMKQFELLFIEVQEKHVTYGLLFLSFGLGIIVFGVFALFGKFFAGIITAFVVAFIGWKLPRPVVNYMIEKRIAKYQSQMVDALQLLSNGLRAGLSMSQSLALVVDELPAPVSQEFNLVLQQNKIGSPMDECLEELVKRVPTEDNDMFVTSVNILRETGGNLAEVFDTIVGVIRERVRLQQKIDTYVAQGMMQGTTIFLMPFILGTLNYFSDPEMMGQLFTKPLGIVFIVAALALDLTGLFFILKIVKIKV